jgi:hypothetical protein
LLAGVAAFALAASAAAVTREPGVNRLRVLDAEVSAEGRAGVVVVAPDLRPADGELGEAFTVWAGGEALAVEASPVAGGELEVAVVVDASSGRPPQEGRELENVAMELALRLPADLRVTVVTMGDPPAVAAGPDSDVLERAAAAGRVEAGGRRALYDALALAVEEFSARPGVHRRLVIVGAGEDEASTAQPAAALERLAAVSAAVYVVQPVGDGHEGLAGLAETSGGLVVPIDEGRGGGRGGRGGGGGAAPPRSRRRMV